MPHVKIADVELDERYLRCSEAVPPKWLVPEAHVSTESGRSLGPVFRWGWSVAKGERGMAATVNSRKQVGTVGTISEREIPLCAVTVIAAVVLALAFFLG